jgi:hypothetical protein
VVSAGLVAVAAYRATTDLEVWNIHEGGFVGVLGLFVLAIAFGAIAFAAYPEQRLNL